MKARLALTEPVNAELSCDDIARFGNDPATVFAKNLRIVQERIAAACDRCGRPPDDVRLLPVTKTVPASILRHALTVGLSDFGENKLQEARIKQDILANLPIRWSIIGTSRRTR